MKLVNGIVVITVICGLLAFGLKAWNDRRAAATGDGAFCISDLTKAQKDADRSWEAARKLIRHYEMCPSADDGQSWDKAWDLYRDWVARGNADATYEFAVEESSSPNPAARREGRRLMQVAAKLGQPAAQWAVEQRRPGMR